MAQIFWEQIRDTLPVSGKYLTGSLGISGSLNVSGTITYNGQTLEEFIISTSPTASTSEIYGTELVDGFIGIATGSFKFVDGTLKAGLFRQTGSYWNTTNNIGITGSFDVALNGTTDQISISASGSETLKVNTEGTLQFISQSVTPQAVAGGIFYSSSDSFYIGLMG